MKTKPKHNYPELNEDLIPIHGTGYTAKRLGISVDGLMGAVRRGEIEGHLRGNRTKFTLAAIKKYEAESLIKPESEPEEGFKYIKKMDEEPIEL